jgi:glycosyltransferase involved in cell wall biosynthesis
MIGDGGIGTYLRELLPRVIAARPTWQFTLLGPPTRLRELATRPGVDVRALEVPIYGVAEQLAIPMTAPRGDLYWAPHYNIPLAVTMPIVATIHDVAHLALAELAGPVERLYARAMFAAVRARARALLFDTEFSRAEFARLVGAPKSVATVAHLGVDSRWTAARQSHPERPIAGPYLVYVGNFKRHKNVPALLRAFGRVSGRIPHKLVLIGRSEGLRADSGIPEAMTPLGDRVVAPGEIAPGELMRYVAHADALVTASRYEGFGFPPLEAMAAGVPCMVSRAGSLPEVCGDAALYCDPLDESDISGKLVDVVTDAPLRDRLVTAGRAQAARFSWEQCTDTTVRTLEGALA